MSFTVDEAPAGASTASRQQQQRITGTFVLVAALTLAAMIAVLWFAYRGVIPVANERLREAYRRDQRRFQFTPREFAQLFRNGARDGDLGGGVAAVGAEDALQTPAASSSTSSGATTGSFGGAGAAALAVEPNNYDDLALSGPLIPHDCRRVARPCLEDSNCALLCNQTAADVAAQQTFVCDPVTLTCARKPPVVVSGSGEIVAGGGGGGGGGGGEPPGNANCNRMLGEFAVLQGYNELGVAQWNCVNLYPGWDRRKRQFCENGGEFKMDARVRPPSYRDCKCTRSYTRMVYRRSKLGQEYQGLPHCMFYPHLFELDYEAV